MLLALAGCSERALQVEAVDPAVASTLDATPITVRGRGFRAMVQASVDDHRAAAIDTTFGLRFGDSAIDPSTIARVDDQTLTATVPAGLAPGLYDLTLTAPDGDRAALAGALRVQAPPALTAAASLLPSAIAAGQDFDFVLAVTNGGDATAVAVAPSLPVATGSAAVILTGMPPDADLAGGASASFTFHYHALAAGDLALTADAAGADGGGHPFVSNRATAATQISTAPVLTASATVTPALVSVGQSFTLTLTVANAGQSAAMAVTPADPVASGSGATTQSSTPAPQTIGPGAQKSFTWTYAATGAGTLSWSFDAAGTDAGGNAVSTPTVSAGPLAIQAAPMLSATLGAAPTPLSIGQTITVTMTVANTGGVTAKGVMPTLPSVSGTGRVSLVTAPGAPADLLPGAMTTFQWTYTATGAGIVAFTSTAKGSDANSGAVVMSAAALSNDVVIQSAASLVATVVAMPASVTVNQVFAVNVTIQNSGGATATNVSSTLPLSSGPGLGTLQSSPTAQDIPGGESRTFTWIFKASGQGTTTFSASGSGTDANSGATITSASAVSNLLTIQTPPSLTLTVSATPSSVLEGKTIDVTVTVTNGGQATATNTIAALALGGTGSATLLSGPAPASADLAGGAMQSYTWQYLAANPGTVTFTASAGGQDANSGAAVSAPTAQSTVTVVKHAALAVAFTVPAVVAAGQTFDVVMTVTNTGGDAAINLAPTALTVAGTSSAALVSGPTPASTAGPIAPAGTTTFTFAYTAGPPGTLSFSGGASGQDATDSTAVSATPRTSSTITVGNPALLSATLTIPASITRSAPFTVTMVVTNGGGNTANAVAPSTLAKTGGATVARVSGPTPPSSNIAAGGNATFTWSYVATANGSFQLGGSAAGTDAMTGQPVSASATSNSAVVADLDPIATDPFGDGTAFAFVFPYNGYVFLGPRGNGAGAMRMNPDGSSPQPVSFAVQRDSSGYTMSNTSAPPYTSIGYTGCTLNSAQCGPDNENGRGVFATGLVGGVPWLMLGGGRSGGGESYAYMTNGTTTSLSLSWVDFSGVVDSSTRALTAAHIFNDKVYTGYAGSGSARPALVRLETLPTPPGLNLSGVDYTNLDADRMPNLKSSALSMIDVIDDFNDRLYLANAGGWMRSTSTNPRPYSFWFSDWVSITPSSTDYSARPSVVTTKVADYEPADRAVPQMASFKGRYYAARNTTSGPQLWMCNPALNDNVSGCDPGDWSLIARNTLGDTRLSQFNDAGNASITLLVATADHLYVGFNNGGGVEVWRSTVNLPTQAADFEGANGCPGNLHATGCAPFGSPGLGNPTANTRIFAGVAATFNARDNLYLVTGNGANGVRVYRVAE
ncbi:MAG: Flagellar hook-length control protein FliK [Myxococcales bacterium]|nr:Flagellar hook-length control protein FliK [Myxococcales bacterium]